MNFKDIGTEYGSKIYFHSPSSYAKRLLYYPIASGIFYCNSHYRVKRDNYDSFQLIYVADGEILLEQGGFNYTAHSGEFLIIDCYKPHYYYAEKNAQTIWLHFDGSSSAEWYNEIKENCGVVIKNYGKSLPILTTIIDMMKRGESELALSSKIYELILSVPLNSKSSSLKENEELNNALKYIADNYGKEISVAALAQTAKLSQSHFSKLFKSYTGLSPYDYLLNVRLEKAKEMLIETDLSISEIASKTGFNSTANFIYFFHKETLASPLKFRKFKH